MGGAVPETAMSLTAILDVDQSDLIIDPDTHRPFIMPKTDLRVILLILLTTFIGSVLGSLLTFWLSGTS